MAAKKRKSDSDLSQQLFDRFYEFSFYRAVYLLERFPGTGSSLERPWCLRKSPFDSVLKKGFRFRPVTFQR
jgi:hypothetical protein